MKLIKSVSLFALALIMSVSTLAILLPGSTASAADPTYKWTGPNTIEALGLSVTGTEGKPAIFGGSNGVYVSDPIYRIPTGQGPGDLGGGVCTFKATITINQADNSKGTLAVQRTDTLDRNLHKCPLNGGPITIANAQGGGAGVVDYAKANCADANQNGGDQAKCDAVKKCINDSHKKLEDCANAWDTCLTTLTNGGAITDANKKKCADLVAAGKIDEAKSVKAENGTRCAIQGIGWLVCPVMNFMASLVDATYGFVKVLLDVPPLNVNTADPNNGAYVAWSTMRNFGNIGFVIMFLIIIFSQVTNVGISNYGIKKMLPRLIMAAVLVNTSYWLCAIAIDLSNIVGSSVNGLFETAAKDIPLPNKDSFGATANGWVGITGGILAGTIATGAAIFIGLSALIPVLISVLFIIIGIFLTLTIRQALVLGIAVISPLIALGKAMPFPGLQNLADKGLKTFWALLIIYPTIGFLFGGSKLASAVIFAIAGNNIAIQIMGAGATILPLGLAVFLRQAIAGIGGAAGKLMGQLNDPSKGPGDRARNAAKGFRERQEARRELRVRGGSRLARITSLGKYGREAKREAIAAGIKSEQARARHLHIANEAANNPAFANRLAGGRTLGANADPAALQRALAGARLTIEKAEAEEVSAANSVIKDLNLPIDKIQDLAKGNGVEHNGKRVEASPAMQAAAIQRQAQTTVKNINELIDQAAAGGMSPKAMQTLADSLATSGAKPAYVGASAIENLRQGRSADSTTLTRDAINAGAYSPDKIANADKDEVQHVANVAATDPGVTAAGKVKLRAGARQAVDDPILGKKLGKSKDMVVRMRDGRDPGRLT